MFIEYISKRFNRSSVEVIEQANEIIDELQSQGFDLTLRQLYYQFVARDLLPNSQRSYNRLSVILSDARLAGLVSWNAIVDRTRHFRENSHWENPEQVLRAARNWFYMDKWEGQENRVEVWIEKDALVGVIEPVCKELDVLHFSCRGYSSQTSVWKAAQRLLENEGAGQYTTILHLGDHDPSGIDMTRDIEDRLTTFGCVDFRVKRIALNMNQIEELNPPPNPAKLSDTRAQSYISKYGHESWELDALDPKYINDLVREWVLKHRDEEIYYQVCMQEKEHLNTIDGFITQLGQ